MNDINSGEHPMKLHFFILILLFTSIQSGFSQFAENMSIFISGGSSIPVESVVGKEFEFPQLSRDTGTDDFGKEILGLTADQENIQDYWNNGFNFGAGMIFEVTRLLSVTAEFNYNSFAFNDNQMAQDIRDALQDPEIIGIPYNPDGLTISQGDLSIYEITAGIRAQLPLGKLRPYLTVAGGYMRINQDPININYYDDFSVPPGPQQGVVSFYDRIPGLTSNALMVSGGGGILLYLSKNLQPFIQANYIMGFTDDQDTILYPVKFGFVFTLK